MARRKTQRRASKQTKNRKRRFLLPYPLFIFLLLCAGAFLVAATFNVGADDILVKAKVSGPLVTSPAVIASPTDGSHFSAIPINVSGTCPTNAAYVEIFRNNLMSGTALCDINSNFQLSMDLFPGQNDLVAHVFNLTDDEGPVSSTVTVYYDVPQPPVSNNPSSPSQPVAVPPLTLKTSFLYKGYYVGQEVKWPIEITGGTSPYAVNVDWDDGNNDVISRSSAGQFDITHQYSTAGNKQGTFTIKIKASDSAGNTAYIQFFVIVNVRNASNAAGNIFGKSPPSLGGKSWLWAAWPAYAIIIVLVVSYWLGEREELIILRKRGLLKR